MTFNRTSRALTTLALTLLLAPAASGEKPKAKAPAAPPAAMDQEAMMKEWAKWSTPGEPHKLAEKSVGKWNAVVRMVMGPGAEPMESKGTAEITAVLGGRWVRQDFTGEFMGQTFHGVGMSGFDNFRKRYISTWIDDMSTSMMVSYGTASKDGKSITYIGLMDEPITGEKDKKVRSVFRWVDDDTFVYESYDKAKGKEWKAMEITYTRAK